MSISERMFQIMEQKKIKSVDIAKHLEINKTVVSAWKKRGTNPPTEYIVQICKLLGVSVYYLLTGKECEELTEEEQKLVEAYRLADPAVQSFINKALDIEPDASMGKSSILDTGEKAI